MRVRYEAGKIGAVIPGARAVSVDEATLRAMFEGRSDSEAGDMAGRVYEAIHGAISGGKLSGTVEVSEVSE